MVSIVGQKEICILLQISPRTLLKFEAAGMPVKRIEGCSPRYDLDAVKKWFAESEKKEG